MKRWQAVVFDLDDTLYPERDYVLSGFMAVARWAEERLNIPFETGYAELKTLFENGVRGNTFDRWLAFHKQHVNDGLIRVLVQVYHEHKPVLRCFREVPGLLASLQRECKVGLVSDGYHDVQRQKLAALHLEQYFDAVVFSDQFGRYNWKPSTKPFVAVSELLSSESSHSIYVADNPLKDFYGARKLGMFTVRVQRADGEYAHTIPPSCQHAPDLTIGSLTDLAGCVPGWDFETSWWDSLDL